MMLTDLADACRKSGLKVIETDSWKTRGNGAMSGVRTIVPHHTAGPATGNSPSLGVVTHGRAGLWGALSQILLARNGDVYIVAAGLCYHAGVVDDTSHSNAYAIGIEAEATGVGQWTALQYDAYVALCAALCDHYDLKVDRVRAHKEIAVPLGRKSDPNFNMDTFRKNVANQMEDTMLDPAVKAQLDRIEADLKQHHASSLNQHKKTRDIVKAVQAIVTRILVKVGA